MPKPFLSFIVPVYNVEKYLEECLDSLVAQDIPCDEYEIICIDDGSTDKSGKILDSYAEKHSNMVVVHQENGGVSSARNCGIEIAKGEYLWFVDSDDFIKKHCLQELKGFAENYDIINFGAYEFNEYFTEEEQYLFDNNKIKANLNYWGFACFHLYKVDTIQKNKIRLIEPIKYGEDEMFYNDMYECSSNIIDLKNVYYFYRRNANSAMCSINNTKNDAYFQSVLLSTTILKTGLETRKYNKDFSAEFLKRRYKVCAHSLSRLGFIKVIQYFNEMNRLGIFDTNKLPHNAFLTKKQFLKLYKSLYLKRLSSNIRKKLIVMLKNILPNTIVEKLKSIVH